MEEYVCLYCGNLYKTKRWLSRHQGSTDCGPMLIEEMLVEQNGRLDDIQQARERELAHD